MILKMAEDKKRKEFEMIQKYCEDPGEEQKDIFIEKIKNGEKVKIPYAAFDYIYRHIDEFGIIGKDGKIILTNQVAFDNIMKSTKSENLKIEDKTKSKKTIQSKTYFGISEEDGKVIEKNHNTGKIKITEEDGSVIVADKHSMTTTKPKDGKSNTKPSTKPKKEPDGKIKAIPEKVEKAEKKNRKKVKSTIDVEIAKNNDELLDCLNAEFDALNIDSEVDTNVNFEQLSVVENEPKEEVKIEPKKSEKKEVKKVVETPIKIQNISIDFGTNFENFVDNFSAENNSEIVESILLNNTNFNFPVILKNEGKLYVDFSYFALLIISNLKNRNDQESFIDSFFKGRKTSSFNIENCQLLIQKINDLNFAENSGFLIYTWKNEDEKEFFLTKRSFDFYGKNYTSMLINIDNLEFDIETVNELEFVSFSKSSTNITSLIFDNYISF